MSARSIFRARRGRNLGLWALALGLTGAAGASWADQLMSVTYTTTPSGEQNTVQTTPDVASATAVITSPNMRVSTVLPTKEGTDVLLLGCKQALPCSDPWYARAGRLQGTAAWGDFQSVINGSLSNTSAGSVNMPAGAWLDATQRQVVVADGTATLQVYDALLAMAPWDLTKAPGWTGWTTTNISLAGGVERIVVSPDFGTIYGASSGSNTIYRATPGSTMDQCTVPFAPGGISDLAVSPDGSRIIAGATDGAGSGHLALVTWPSGGSCTATQISPGETKPPFASILVPQEMPWQVFTTRSNGEVQQWSQTGAAGPTLPTSPSQPGMLSAQPSAGGQGLVLSSQPPLPLIANGGDLVPTPLSQFLQLSFSGGSFSLASTLSGQGARVALRGAAPAFTVDGPCAGCTGSHRTVDLSAAYTTAGASNGARVAFLPIMGGANQALTLYAGTCTRTTVIEAYSTAGSPSQLQIGKTCAGNSDCASNNCVSVAGVKVCEQLLGAQLPAAAFTAKPQFAGSPDALLAFAQLGTGENCQMTLAKSPGGAGAAIEVSGSALGSRALALVLDRSGSMALPVGGTGPNASQSRQQALTNAVDQLIATIGLLPDAAQAKVVVVPYESFSIQHELNGGMPYTGTALAAAQATINGALAAGGGTNIRGALLTAAQQLNALQQMGTSSSSTVLLMTDGLHNTLGQGAANDDTSLKGDDVSNLWKAASDLTGGPGLARVSQLYSVALSVDATGVDSLKQLMSQFYYGNTLNPNPQGFLDYADDGAALSLFFNKVLWNYLGASSVLDPLVVLNDGQPPYTQTIDLTYQAQPVVVNYSLTSDGIQYPVDGRDQELIVVVTWQDQNRFPDVSLTYTDVNKGMGTVRCGKGTHVVTCYLPLSVTAPGTKPVLTVGKDAKSQSGELDVVVEAAARSPLQLRAAADRLEYYSGQTVNLQAGLREHGLPVTGATVTGTIVTPSGALGTALANAPVSAAQITGLLKSQPDLTGPAAKLHLMSPSLIPGTGKQTITFFDDGKHGDGVAGDGVYGAQLAAPLPGDYKLTVQASYNSRFFGAGSRQTYTSIRVGVGLDGKKSLLNVLAYSPPTGSGNAFKPGTLVAWLRPQDSMGNLLGPGNGNSIVFKQNGATLPATHDEPGNLDGTYTVVVTGIGPSGPVSLVTPGGSGLFTVVPKPDEPGGGIGGGGCGCRSVATPAALPVPAAALALLGLVLLMRRRRA